MRRGDIHRLGAFLLRLVGEREQRADLIGRKAEAARVADEPEPLQMQLCEPPAARGAAFGRREQPDLFVKADGVHLRADAPPNLADAHDLIVAATAVPTGAFPPRSPPFFPAIHSHKPLIPPVTGG